jgi:hypothetical protein
VLASAVAHGISEQRRARRAPEGPSAQVMVGIPRRCRSCVIPPKTPALPGAPKELFIVPAPRVRASSSARDIFGSRPSTKRKVIVLIL